MKSSILANPFGKSDHEVLTFTVLNGHHKNETQREKLNFNEIDLKSFRPPIQNVSWDDRIHTEGLMRAYSMCAETVTQAIEVSVPAYTIKERRKAPWSTRGIEKLAKKKRSCWHRYKYKEFDPESPECARYKAALAAFNAAKENAITRYEKKIIEDKPRNQKRYYAYLSKKSKYRDSNLLLRNTDGTESSNPKQCAKILSSCYSSVYTRGNSPQIPNIKTPRVKEGMKDVTFSPEKVRIKLESLNTSKTTGPDRIPALLLKQNSEMFAPILSLFFTESYKQGIVPEQLKLANVTPIYKGGNRKDPSNYRPVSITPIIAKIFESIILEDVSNHMEYHNVITPSQHGFQKSKSTTTNLLEFWDYVTEIADNSSPLSVIYTDLRKAFDSVPHDLLLAKVEHYGIRGKTLTWISSFLQDRKQRVVVGDDASDYAPVLSGVPQGGVLSGLLFSLYINDLPMNMEHTASFSTQTTRNSSLQMQTIKQSRKYNQI